VIEGTQLRQCVALIVLRIHQENRMQPQTLTGFRRVTCTDVGSFNNDLLFHVSST
jgi:hypothetical protein